MEINISIPRGSATVPLLDVAFVPKFSTSLISLKKALSKGFHWDTKTMNITNDAHVIITVEVRFDTFIAEYNQVKSTFTSARIESDTKNSAVTATILVSQVTLLALILPI